MTTKAETLMHDFDSQPLAYLVERRRFPRVRLSTPLAAHLGRVEGVVVDLCARGARMHHKGIIPCSGTHRFTLKWQTTECSATAVVISSRLLNRVDGSTSDPLFETRLRLVEVPHTSEHLLGHFLVRVGRRRSLP